MKRPCARDGFTPISSRVRTAEDDPEPELGGGGGEPCRVAGAMRCIGGSVWTWPDAGAPAAEPAATGAGACGAGATTGAETATTRGAGGAVAVTPDAPA